MIIKRLISISTALMLVATTITATDYISEAKMTPTSMIVGETLQYEAFFQWGVLYIDGADLTTTVRDNVMRDEQTYQVYATAKTNKTAKTFYMLADTFSVDIRRTTMEPLYFYEHDIERNWNCYYYYDFYPSDEGLRIESLKNIVSKNEVLTDTVFFKKSWPMDVLSLLYRIRCFDLTSLKEGDKIWFDNYMFPSGNLTSSIEYIKTEKIKLRRGAEIESMKFQFSTAVEGTLFSKKNPVYIWIENTPPHRIVHAESKLTIGYVKLDLLIKDMK